MGRKKTAKCIDCGKLCCKLRCQNCSNKLNGFKKGQVGGILHPLFGKKRPEHSIRMMGENNPNYKGGLTPVIYPLGWTNTYKEQIRHRDNYRCQVCGCHEVECTRKLHVHHIDYNKFNLREKNLISLCHSCHMKTNGTRKYWIEIFNKKLLIGK